MSVWQVVMTAPELAPEAAALLQEAGCKVHYMRPFPPAAEVAEAVRREAADAVICRQGRVNGAVMDASPRLRIVARHGVGMDEVDLAAARERGMLVTRAPGSNTLAVAEHTIALILALAKDIVPLSASVAQGGWRPPGMKLRDLSELRLGLVGFGPIGQKVATFAGALGLQVAATHPSGMQRIGIAPGDIRPGDGVARMELPALLARSDVLSLHCPLLPETRGLIDAAALALLPRGAMLVNAARGGLVDEAALLAALESGTLGGAALDVFADEPPAPDDKLRRHRKVICTPHVAGVTRSSMRTMGVMAAECVIAALEGREVPPDRVVVPGRPATEASSASPT
jgi:D-3-phosphoglycerate dehydrogenase / 2-oxoglutarate reductase